MVAIEEMQEGKNSKNIAVVGGVKQTRERKYSGLIWSLTFGHMQRATACAAEKLNYTSP